MLTLGFFEMMAGLLEAVVGALLGYWVDAVNARIVAAILGLLGLGEDGQ